MDIVQELGAFGLCAAMLGLLGWIIKKQANTISNHIMIRDDLTAIQRSIDRLPCRRGAPCPVEEDPCPTSET